MVFLLRADAALPQAQRLWLRDFAEPRIETSVGVAKEGQAGVRFVDVLVSERKTQRASRRAWSLFASRAGSSVSWTTRQWPRR